MGLVLERERLDLLLLNVLRAALLVEPDRARDAVSVDSDAVDRAADGPPIGGGGRVETPESLLLRDSLGPELQAAMDALPDVFRQAVWLRDVEEFSYADIAEMLDIPPGTVMSRISRGRRFLYEALKATTQSPVVSRQSSVSVVSHRSQSSIVSRPSTVGVTDE